MSQLFLAARCSLVLCLAAGSVAGSQGQRERPRYVLQTLDLNHDGILSPEELQAAPTSLLTLDRNGDGELTPDELEPPRTDAGASPDQLATQLMAFDKNGDGVLTPDELPARLQSLFARADSNHDGKLTPEEIRQSAAHTGGANGRRGGPGSAGGNMRMDPVLAALDADHDGILSAAEIHGATLALLTLDANHDGIVQAAEMPVRQQTAQQRTDHLLEEWDTDKDGKLSKDEAPDGMRSRFADADKNGDGYLDRAELLQMFSAAPAGPKPQSGGTTPAPSQASPASQPKGQHD